MIADFILDLANVGWVDESEIALAVETAIAFCGDECDRFWKVKGKMAIAITQLFLLKYFHLTLTFNHEKTDETSHYL